MLTGDNRNTAAAIADELHLDEYLAEVLPEDKAAYISSEQAAGRTVVMIGDGINDTPALSLSDVGIAVGSGAVIAREIADVTIAAEDLIYYGLEYKFVTEYVIGRTTFDEMFRQLEIAIHQFAKRQMTWFRGMERRGFTIHWLDAALPVEEKVEMIKSLTP